MDKFVGILLSKSIFELLFILSVDQVRVFFANFPLSPRAELLDRGEAPSSVGVVLGDILVSSKFHLEVQLSLIWLPEIVSSSDQVLILATISSVIEVDHARRVS